MKKIKLREISRYFIFFRFGESALVFRNQTVGGES